MLSNRFVISSFKNQSNMNLPVSPFAYRAELELSTEALPLKSVLTTPVSANHSTTFPVFGSSPFNSLYCKEIDLEFRQSTSFCSKRLWMQPQRVEINRSALRWGMRLLKRKRMILSLKGPCSRKLRTGELVIIITGTLFFLVNFSPYLLSNRHCCPSRTRRRVLFEEASSAWPAAER